MTKNIEYVPPKILEQNFCIKTLTNVSVTLVLTFVLTTKWSNTLKQFVGNSQQIVSVCLTIL